MSARGQNYVSMKSIDYVGVVYQILRLPRLSVAQVALKMVAMMEAVSAPRKVNEKDLVRRHLRYDRKADEAAVDMPGTFSDAARSPASSFGPPRPSDRRLPFCNPDSAPPATAAFRHAR